MSEPFDTRRWTLEGDPPRVHSGPAIYPGMQQRVVPETKVWRQLARVEAERDQLREERDRFQVMLGKVPQKQLARITEAVLAEESEGSP